MEPCRVADTRWPAGPEGGPPVAARSSLTLFRSDMAAAPQVSTVNFTSGRTRANNAVVRLSVDGEIQAKNGSAAAVDFVLDVNGYFQ